MSAELAEANAAGLEVAAGFVAALRRAGLEEPVASALSYLEALGAVGLGAMSSVYWAGRATLVPRVEDVARYDEVFARYFLAAHGVADPGGRGPARRAERFSAPSEPAVIGHARYSRRERLAKRDFASLDPAELAETRAMIDALALRRRARRTRRWRVSARVTGRADLRASVRAMGRQGGELWEVARRSRKRKPRRIVVLCDVSGSMERYSAELLRFAHVLVASGGRVEAFAFGTRLTRLTRELASHDPDAALAAAAGAVPDWSGGTRLGAALGAFNQQYGVRGAARGAIVMICSDGLDRGDVNRVGEEMARLSRVAARVIWVNPLKATDGYEPLARAMAAALPYVDEFCSGHSLAALGELMEYLERAA